MNVQTKKRIARIYGNAELVAITAFKPSEGWLPIYRTPVNQSTCRELELQGFTFIGIEISTNRVADFSLEELNWA
jgi:hypothetical protein